MKLNMKQIAILVAGFSASTLSYAHITPAEIEAVRTTTLQQAWLTGASAPTLTVYLGWLRGCDVNTSSIFTNQAASNTNVTPGTLGDFTAYACRRGGVPSVLYHTMDGGSLNAYTPHSVGTVLSRVAYVGDNTRTTGGITLGCATSTFDRRTTANVFADVYKGCRMTGVALTAAGPAATNNNNQTGLNNDPQGPKWPTGGYSDVEAALFSANIGGGDRIVDRGLEENVGAGQVFTVAASIPLYRALQAEQNIPNRTTQLDPDFLPENAPNITSGQYAGLISKGGRPNWSPLLAGNTTTQVNIARRVDTSGTQSSSNAFFLRNPCSLAIAQSISPRQATDTVAGRIRIVEEGGTGGVKTRLNTASLPATTDINDQYWIGVMSAENDPRSENAGYRFLKIDGVHPETGDLVFKRKTAAAGDYKFHMELKSFVREDYAGRDPKTPFEQVVIGEITTQLSAPPANTCATFPRGLTLNPLNGSACTNVDQVALMTNSGKNCQTAVQFNK